MEKQPGINSKGTIMASDSSIFELCKKEFEYIQKARRHIHRHPELGFDVQKTAAFITSELQKLPNIKITNHVGISGVVADLPALNKKNPKRIALRADMDALPIQEQNTHEYKSVHHGKAQMCGHDAHTAMLLGAARILSQHQNELNTDVRFIFQPNEENAPGGAPAMIKDGVLDGVDEIFGMHVWPLIPVTHYGLCRGATMGRPDVFQIHLKGVGGHASIPHKTVDPIVIGAQLVSTLQTIVSRNVYFKEAAVLSVTQFHAGTTHNVIPETAFIEGTIRTFNNELSDLIIHRIQEIVTGFEKAFDIKAELNVVPGYPVLINNSDSISYTESCLKKLYPEKDIRSYEAPNSLGGEDFAYYLEKIPGCYVFLGCSNIQKGITQICHDPHFEIDEDCLIYGTALHCQWALNYSK